MKHEAYWISPRGEIAPVEGTAASHITTIGKNPGFFGLTRKQYQAEHQKQGERLGIEGRAREIIMKALLEKGWIRIRYVPKTLCFTVQTAALNRPRLMGHLLDWALKTTDGRIDSLDPDTLRLKIISLKARECWSGSLGDFISRQRAAKTAPGRTRLVHLKRRE